MDLYNLVMKIPYILMVLVGITFIIQLYVGGLNNLSIDIDSYNEEQYRSTVVLENTLSVEENGSEELGYSYDHRRGVIPIEFFNQELDSEEDEPGYKKNGEHCYIPRVAGLDGENFAFYIINLDSDDTSPDLDCTEQEGERSKTVFSPVLLVRDGDPVPARLYVYGR